MLGGQVAVFVSCSEKFKQALAWPVRDALASRGLRGVIVTDEPRRWRGWTLRSSPSR
jgi:hypothetical protein